MTNGDDSEIAKYIQGLLDHHIGCELDDCASCRTLHGILELVRRRLFTSPLFPEVMVSSASVTAKNH